MNILLNNTRVYHDQAERAEELARKERDRKRRRALTAIADHLYMAHDELVKLDKLNRSPAILPTGPKPIRNA